MAPILLFAMSMSAFVHSQTCAAQGVRLLAPSGSGIYGQVLDRSGAPIPEAQVLLKSISGQRTYRVADRDGCFAFTAPPMHYSLAARSEAFRIGSLNVDLAPGKVVEENIVLEVGGCTECVEVQGMRDFSPCVVDEDGVPIAVARVTLVPKKPENAAESKSISLNDWGCGYAQLPDSHYRVSLTAPGYKPFETDVSLKPGSTFLVPSHFRMLRSVQSVLPPRTQPSLAIKASIGTYRLDAGDTLTADLTITNLSTQVSELCPWSDSCTVHVIGENGEPPTTYRQRDATNRLLPGEAPLERTLYAGWFIAPGKTDTHHWILKDLYNLSTPGKYKLYFDVRDPKTEELLHTDVIPFTVAASDK